MAMLDSVLREKHLRRTQRLQELAEIRARCEASEQVSATAQRLHEEAHAFLWRVMTTEELCVQRLSIAKAQGSAAQRAAARALEAHTLNVRKREDLQRILARIEKDIEKLLERQELSRSAALSDHLKREWRELDDWVLGMRGGIT